MKITAKTTKEQLVKALGANSKAVQKADKNVYDQMVYTSNAMKKDEKSVTKRDLADLVKLVMTTLGDKFVEPAFAEEAPQTEKKAPAKESSLKKKVTKKAETTEPEVVSEQSADEEEAVKSAKKTGTKKSVSKPKKDAVEVLEGTDKEATVQMAKLFPKKVSVGDETYDLASDIKSMEDLHKALEGEQDIVFAFYWTARHIKQFNYSSVLKHPKKFDNDLDLATVIYASDDGVVAYAISMYTEANYQILPTDFEVIDGLMYCNGIEYQIYRKAE